MAMSIEEASRIQANKCCFTTVSSETLDVQAGDDVKFDTTLLPIERSG